MTAFEEKHKDSLEQPITMGLLLEYTDEFLIPKVAELIGDSEERTNKRMSSMEDRLNKRIAKEIHELKAYIDDKMADYTSDIFKRLEKRYTLERKFMERVVELIKKNNLGTAEDVAYLEGILEVA